MFNFEDKKATYLFGLAALMCYLLINQGGYFPGAVVSTGVILSVLLLRKQLVVKVLDIAFLAFSLWYLFCSLKAGFDINCVSKGLIPLSILMFRWLLPGDAESNEELLKKVMKVSFYIALLGVLSCVLVLIQSKTLGRLQMPFQYANSSGIFFGLMFILSRYMGFDWARKRQIVFLLALLLTQSVGAVGLTLIAELCLNPHKKRSLIIVAVLGVGAFILRERIFQSMGTFIERFLQNYDGFVCMLKNPLFGLGAGKWNTHKNLYQSGIYVAREIHGCLMQVGVASGILGFLLFGFCLVWAFKTIKFENKAYCAGALMLVGHSLLDFSFSFLAIGFLLILLFACGKEKEGKAFSVKLFISIPCIAVCLAGFLICSTALSQMKRLDSYHDAKNHTQYIEYYESHWLARQEIDATEDYARALFELGDTEGCLAVLHSMEVLSSDMILLEYKCTNSWEGVFEYAKQQPYNTIIYQRVYYNCDDEELKKETKKRFREARDAMSFLGKTLYQFIGDEIL